MDFESRFDAELSALPTQKEADELATFEAGLDQELSALPLDEDKSIPFGSVKRGFNQLQMAGTMWQSELGLITEEEAAKLFARDLADAEQAPVPPSYKAAMAEIGEAGEKGWGPLALSIIQNPTAMASVVGESIPMSAAMMGAGVAGSVAGPVGTMAGAGAVSFGTEYSSSIIETLQEAKVDMHDTEAVEAALKNDELMGKARSKAAKRGLAVGAFDALSMGVAGRIAKVVGATAEDASRLRRAVGGVAETGAQAAAGGAGEAAAQVATEGRITDRAAIGLEAGAEAVTGIPEVIFGMEQQAVPKPAPPDLATDTGVLPEEELSVDIVPPDQGPPPPPEQTVPFGDGKLMQIDDPAFVSSDGEEFPASPMHGQTVEVLETDEYMSKVRLQNGDVTEIGNDLLVEPPEQEAPPTPEGLTPTEPLIEPAPEPEPEAAPKPSILDAIAPPADTAAVPDSPRLTEQDRSSPIPNELIDAGKALVESASGQPSTYTTTTEINGRREVVTGRVADLVASQRMDTQSVTAQIMEGVSTPEILTGTLSAALESATAGVPATSGPTAPEAPVRPSIATGEAPAVELAPSDVRGGPAPEAPMMSASRIGPPITADMEEQLTRRYGPVGTQARTLEEARLADPEPVRTEKENGDVIEVTQPNYETFEARINGQKVGTLNMSPRGPYASSVTVEPSARRQGVGTALYQAAERALGRQMVPSPMGMSGDAIGFWKKRFADVEPEEKQRVLQEALEIGQEAKIGNSARARVDALGYQEPGTPTEKFLRSYRPPEGVDVDVRKYLDADDTVAVAMLERTTGAKGAGIQALRDLTTKADAAGVKVRLTVEEAAIEKLAPLYKELGFKTIEKRDGDLLMQRKPAAAPDIGVMEGETDRPARTVVSEPETQAPLKERLAAARALGVTPPAEAAVEAPKAPKTAVRMTTPTGEKVLISGDILDESKFRVTVFDKKGLPTSKTTYDTFDEAQAAAQQAGHVAVAEEPAAQSALKAKIAAKRAPTDAPYEAEVGKPNVINRIDTSLSEEDKVAVLTNMTEENKPIIQDFMRRVKEKFDAFSEDSEKKPARILQKSERPSLLKAKPWHRVEHIRDAYRFRTQIKSYKDLPGIIKSLEDMGVAIIKRDIDKVLEPGEYGWRVTAYDLYMPNGQLVEYYLAADELMEVNRGEGHKLFEKWRNEDFDKLTPEQRDERDADIKRSYKLYNDAWEAYLARSGDSLSDIKASLNKAFASSGDSLTKSSKSPPLKPLTNQSPSRRYMPTRADVSTTYTNEGSSLERQASASSATELTSFPRTNVVQSEPTSKGEKEETPKFQARTLREGTETAESIGLPPTREVVTPKGKTLLKKIVYNTYKIATALQARQRARYGTIARNDRSPEAIEQISDWMVDEVLFEMQPGRETRSGVGWYSHKFQRALDAFGAVFPELTGGKVNLPGVRLLGNQKNARDFFTALIAITSDGAKVNDNFANARRLYGEFRQTGTISTAGMTGGADRITSMRTNVNNILKLLADKGPDGMHKTLMEEDTVANLKQKAKLADTVFSVKLQAHMRMPLSALVFGPKLGAFYANLMGAHGYLTMDRWWSRTFNRYRGQLLKRISGTADRPTDRQGNKIGLAKFKETIGQPNLSDDEALLEAYRHSKLYEEKGFKNGTAVEKAANTIRKDAEGTEDTPWGPVDRTFMIEAVERARTKLAERGTTISLADIQAILWYYEKRLYSELGARGTADISYEEVARRIAAQGDQGDRPGRPAVQAASGEEDGPSFSLNIGSGPEEGRAAQFVSPSVAEGGGIAEAVDGIGSDRQRALQKANREIDDAFGLNGQRHDAIGAWSDGAENTTVTVIEGNADWEKVRVTSAMKGHLADQKAVLVFKHQDGGTSALHRIHVPETNVQTLHENLIADGVAFHTIVPQKSGTDVFVVDLDGSAGAAVNTFAERYNVDADTQIGQAEFIGTSKEDGTAREQRDDARRAYEEVIRQSPVKDSQEHWSRIRDHWGETLEPKPKLKVSEKERREQARQKTKAATKAATEAPGRKAETRKVPGGQIHLALSPAFAEKAAAVLKDLRAALDKLGLTGVDLKVWQQIFADMDYGALGVDGIYHKSLIDISLQAPDAMRTLHHEAVHAMRALKLFRGMEWAILERKAKDWITDDIRANYPEDQWVEEAIAYAFDRWSKGARFDGVITQAFKKMQALMKAIYSTLTKHEIRTSEDIFVQMLSGQIGKRSQKKSDPGMAKVDAFFQIGWHATDTLFDRFSTAFISKDPNRQWFGRGLYFMTYTDVGGLFQSSPYNYTVDIPDDEEMLNWDKKLSEMSEAVQAKVKALLKQHGGVPQGIDKGVIRNRDSVHALGPDDVELYMAEESAAVDAKYPNRSKDGTGELTDDDFGWFNAQSKLLGKLRTLWESAQTRADMVARAQAARSERLAKAPKIADPTGKQIHEHLGLEKLREGDIPGHSYSAMEGRRSKHLGVVIYDEDKIKILSRNGKEVTPAEKTAALDFVNDRAMASSPRFALTTAPHTPTQAGLVTQGLIARGQPIDRAIRVVFDLLGGLDNQNQWKPAKRLTDKMGPVGLQGAGIGGIIGSGIGGIAAGPLGAAAGFAVGGTVGSFLVKANPSPTGAFRWYGPIAENAKRGLIDRYGLDPQYVEAERKADLAKGDILRQAQGILKVLSSAGVGTSEAKVLQAVLTGEPVNDADMTRLAVPIRQAIDDLGAEAVSLGLISAESFDRNRGAYLHRVYTKNEADQNNLVRWVSNVMSNKRKRIIGDQLKGRGIFLDITQDRLMKDASNYPVPAKGASWRILDRMNAAGDKASKRVYWPANKPIPMEYQGSNWVDRGEWEVRQIEKGKVTLWRDYTKDERTKMGELIDARYNIAKTFMLMANDLSTGRFYKEVAGKAEWTQTAKPAAKSMSAEEYNRYWNDPEVQWVKVPDTSIQDTGGKKRWGALAGKYVRAEIWRDLNEMQIAQNPRWWRSLMTQWKLNKTARNPVVHMNNVMSNMMFMDLADVRMQDLIGGIKAYATSSAAFIEARDNGAFGSDMISQEIRDNVLKPILEEITKQQVGTRSPLFAGGIMQKTKVLGIVADKLWSWAKTVDNGMLRAYQAEDEIFRMAAYMRRRSLGDDPRTAALNARDQFLNYDIRAPWVNALRNTALPFISYTYRAVPKLMETIMHRPWKLAKYAAIAYGVNALSYMLDDLDGGDDDGEERERAALRKEEQGFTWLGVERMVRMPWRDAHGLPVFLDVRRWVPAGDIFDNTTGSTAIPIPTPLQFGGPLQLAFELALNKQAFTGEEITNELVDTTSEKFTSVADWAWKAWMPGAAWVPNSWYWTKISNALHGAKDSAGRPYSVPQALLTSVGVKLRPLDVESGVMWNFYEFERMERLLMKRMRTLSTDLERGLISQSAFDKGAANIAKKFETMGQRAEDLDKRTQKPKRERVE